MLHVIFPVTNILFTKSIDIGPFSISFIIFPFADVGIPEWVVVGSFTVFFPIFPFTLIFFATNHMKSSPTIEKIRNEITYIGLTIIIICKCAFSFTDVIDPLTFICISIGINVFANSMAFPILEITCIIEPIFYDVLRRIIVL